MNDATTTEWVNIETQRIFEWLSENPITLGWIVDAVEAGDDVESRAAILSEQVSLLTIFKFSNQGMWFSLLDCALARVSWEQIVEYLTD